MNIEDLLPLLSGVRKSGTKYSAYCPAHDDNRQSLSLTLATDEKILMKCHAGCSNEAICQALSISMSDLMPPRDEGRTGVRARISETYNYTDESGNLIYQVVRKEPKGFHQRRPDGNGGWISNLNGIRPVPYRLPKVLEAIATGIPVWIAEGERDVHTLEGLGLVATTNSGGAGKWPAYSSENFRDAHVVVVPDNDEPGRKHAHDVAASLRPVAKTVRVLDLPYLPPKGDVTDWIMGGGTLEHLLALVKQTPLWEPSEPSERVDRTGISLLRAGDFLGSIGEPPPMLVEGLLPDHSLVLVSGKPKYGKSLLVLDFAESIAANRAIWGTRSPARHGPVVYLGMEDGKYEIANRLLRRGLRKTSDLPFYICAERVMLGTEDGVATLKAAVAPLSPLLVIVDTAREALGVRDYSDPAELTDRLRPLREFAREVCTVLLVAHNRKAEATDAVDEIAGSNGLTSAVDGWISARRKEDRQEDGKRLRRLHLDIDGRGGMRGSLVVEMDSDDLKFREVTDEEQGAERGEARAEADATRFKPVLEFLEKNKQSTVADIVQGMEYNEKRVRRLLDDMFEAGLVSKTEPYVKDTSKGRPPMVYDIVTLGQHPKYDVPMSEREESGASDPWEDEPEEI